MATKPTSYTAVGNLVYADGGGEPINRCASHGEAIRDAQDRTSKSQKATLSQTSFVTISLDFGDAQTYESVVDVSAATASDLAAETDPAKIQALLARTAEQVQAAHTKRVQAKRMPQAFEHRGQPFSAGDFVILSADGHGDAMLAADFEAHYRPVQSAVRPAAPKE